jgi:hypothetical protein
MKKLNTLTSLIICLAWIAPGQAFASARPKVEKTVYADALAPGWQDWSWATADLGATSPVHSGSHSIAVNFGAWEGLYLHNADIDTLGTDRLRFYIHGGGAGGQQMNVILNLWVNGSDQNGPAVAVPPAQANSWSEIQVSLSELNPTGAAVTGITWQDSSGGSQPTVYIDDIAFASLDDPDAPQISEPEYLPRALPADGSSSLVVRARVTDPQGTGNIASVSLDASGLGRRSVPLHDDGRSNDGGPGDGLYGAALSVAPGTPPGEHRLLLTTVDQEGHPGSLSLGVVTVLSSAGGSIPAALPQNIGWGSNAWSEESGKDWQENSGVPWGYVYQYITYGWETWGGSFVQRFVGQAWDKGFIPVVTVYIMLGVPLDCGEGGACYAEKLQDASTVQEYLDSLLRAAQEAQGTQPVIFNLEPDFYGFMQQLSNSDSRPPGVQPNDPATYPVALNKAGYPNNLSGFGRYMVDMIHATAANALVAPMASMWATNQDPQLVTQEEAMQMGASTAAFIDAMGGTQADLLVVEWSDRDAGSGLRPWWDDTDQETPRPTRAVLWENALSRTAQKRLLLWQIPVGNMSLDNTCDHYQDNRAAYAFSHPRDLFDAGVAGVLFGGGATCMTGVETDGGFVAAQGAIAYSPPSTPLGFEIESTFGASVILKWQENSEPDLWKYRLVYGQVPAGVEHSMDAGRQNGVDLLLPHSGDWEIRITAVDAMGNSSAPSPPLALSIDTDVVSVYLPVITTHSN